MKEVFDLLPHWSGLPEYHACRLSSRSRWVATCLYGACRYILQRHSTSRRPVACRGHVSSLTTGTVPAEYGVSEYRGARRTLSRLPYYQPMPEQV